MPIIDCFTFFDGLDILEIRLNTLAPYVDRFVLCESPYTHAGTKKRLCFDENKERFKDFNITHLIVDDHEKHMDGGNRYAPNYYQIAYMVRGLPLYKPHDIILVSDFDEIPDLSNYKGEEGVFRLREYYYYLNCYTGNNNWHGTTVRKRRHIFTSLSMMRRRRNRVPIIGTGWHFTYMYSIDGIIKKINAFTHQEVNTDEVKLRVAECRENLVDPFGVYKQQFKIEDPTGPQWLLDNREKYEHLFYKEKK